MFASSILDTAIAIIFVFLLVSLVVTTLNEGLAGLFVSRAKWLRVGINRLLTPQMADQFYDHSLIKSFSSHVGFFRRILKSWVGQGPSYVPSRTFAVTLLDIVSNRDARIEKTRNALQDLVDRAPPDNRGTEFLRAEIGKLADGLDTSTDIGKRIQADLRVLVDVVSKPGLDAMELAKRLTAIAQAPVPVELKTALQRLAGDLPAFGAEVDVKKTTEYIRSIADSIPTEGQAIAAKLALQNTIGLLQSPALPPKEGLRQIRDFIESFSDRYVRSSILALPESELKKSLVVLLNEADGDVDKLKQTIEIWFNNAMDRVGGWYKRRTSLVVLILAAIVTLGLNVDTLLVLQTLESQASLRDAIVGKAKGFAERPSTSGTGGRALRSVPPSVAVADSGDVNARTDLFDTDNLNKLHAQIDALSLPIGWFSGPSAGGCASDSDAANRLECARAANHQLLPPSSSDWGDWMGEMFGNIKFHGLGWLLTIIAASLGAPFWFDTLNKVIAIRSVGKAPEEAQKPPKKVPLPLEPGQTPGEAEAQDANKRNIAGAG
jgi:hypothetical protein